MHSLGVDAPERSDRAGRRPHKSICALRTLPGAPGPSSPSQEVVQGKLAPGGTPLNLPGAKLNRVEAPPANLMAVGRGPRGGSGVLRSTGERRREAQRPGPRNCARAVLVSTMKERGGTQIGAATSGGACTRGFVMGAPRRVLTGWRSTTSTPG